MTLAGDTNTAQAAVTKTGLARLVRMGLRPPPFPPRREAEFAIEFADAPAGTCMGDIFWPDPHLVAIVLARLADDGLDGAVAAAALRPLLRAALASAPGPAAALAACRDLGLAGQADIAAVLVDLRSGSARAAAQGRGAVLGSNGKPACGDTLVLAPGTALTLGIGDFPAAVAEAGTSAATLTGRVLREAGDAAAAGVLLFWHPARATGIETAALANDIAEVPRVLAQVGRFCAQHGVAAEAAAEVELALDEILTNLVSYAFRDGARHAIELEMACARNRLSLELRDDGVPFDPLKVPPPDLNAGLGEREIGGLGMHFVRGLVDEIAYRREAGWNILRLAKHIDRRGDKGGPA